MKKAKTNKSSKKAGSKNKNKGGNKQSKQQKEINQALAAAAAAQASANSANAAAAANAAALSTANASYAAALSTANASNAAVLSTANASNAAVLSTANASNAAALSTGVASNAAQELQNAVNNLALAANSVGTGYLSLVGGPSANYYYGATEAAALNAGNFIASYATSSPSDTLNGNNFINLPTAITGTASGISFYMIGGPSADTIIGNSSANTIIGGSGADIITSGGGADSIDGGLGVDTFNFANGQLASSVTLNGGSGATNAINFTAAATVANADFANVSNVQSINGTNGLNITVGSSAQQAGVSTITGGLTDDSFTDVATGTVPFTFIGGSGADTFSFASTDRLAADYIHAGSSTSDMVSFTTDGVSVVDSAFARITGTIESLSLSNGNNSVTLGTTARNIGLTTVTTGSEDDYISVGATFTNAATFNAGSGNDTFVISNTSAATFNGGLGNDTFSTGQTGNHIFNSILQGSSGTNVLAFTGVQTSVVDSGFTSASNIQNVTSVGTLSAVLGNAAGAAGVVSVTGSTYADSIIYSGSYAITFAGGIGNDSLSVTGAQTSASTFDGGAGNDYISFTSSAQFTAASVVGGEGTDTIGFDNNVALTDAAFNRISASTIEVLSVTNGSGSSIIIGSNALAAGITSVYGGTGSDVLNASAYGTNGVLLAGGSGADNLIGASSGANTFLFQDQNNFVASAATGGSSIDTIAFQNAVTVDDGNFSNYSGMNAVALYGTSGSQFGFGTNGSAAGITSVTGVGSGAVNFTLSANTNSVTFNGGAGADNFTVTGSDVLSFASIIGGQGNDSLTFGTADSFSTTIQDSSFARVSGVEVVVGTTTTTFNVGSTAIAAGVTTMVSGTDSATFNIGSDVGTNGISLNSSAGTGTFNFVNGAGFAISSITGGVSTDDKIVFSDAVTVNSTRTVSIISGVDSFYLNGSVSSSFTYANGGNGAGVTAFYGTNAGSLINLAGKNEGRASLFGGSSYSDTFTGGSGNDTLQGWNSLGSNAIDTLTGGLGADYFVIATGFTGATSAGVVGYTGGFYAVITDYGSGDILSVGNTMGTSSTGGGSLFSVNAVGATGFNVVFSQNGSSWTIAQGTFASGYTAGVVIG